MTKANVTYLSKSEGGRGGEALRADERGAGGYERQSFDRGFKYLLCTSNDLSVPLPFISRERDPSAVTCTKHVFVRLTNHTIDSVSFIRSFDLRYVGSVSPATCCHAEGEKVRVSLTQNLHSRCYN